MGSKNSSSDVSFCRIFGGIFNFFLYTPARTTKKKQRQLNILNNNTFTEHVLNVSRRRRSDLHFLVNRLP